MVSHNAAFSNEAEAKGVEQCGVDLGSRDGGEGGEGAAPGGGEYVAETNQRRSERGSGGIEETDRRVSGQGEEEGGGKYMNLLQRSFFKQLIYVQFYFCIISCLKKDRSSMYCTDK